MGRRCGRSKRVLFDLKTKKLRYSPNTMDDKCDKCGGDDDCCDRMRYCLTCKKECCCKCYAWTGCQTMDCICRECFDYKCMYPEGQCRRKILVNDKPYIDDGDYLNSKPYCNVHKAKIKDVCSVCTREGSDSFCKKCEHRFCYDCLCGKSSLCKKCFAKGSKG